MIDGHVHLENGPLTKEYVLKFIHRAKQVGLRKIQILDHTHRFIEFRTFYDDVYLANIDQAHWLNSTKKFKDSIVDYLTLIEEIKQLSLDIEVLFGLEVCFSKKNFPLIKDVLSNYKFDFLVGAVHSINGILYDMSFSGKYLWNVFPINQIYTDYYQEIIALIKTNYFTQLAHPDTIKIAQKYPNYDLRPIYHQIADFCVLNNIKVENNIGCHYRYHHADCGLNQEFYQILKQHNVKIINCSDAHYPQDVGREFYLLAK